MRIVERISDNENKESNKQYWENFKIKNHLMQPRLFFMFVNVKVLHL